MTVEKLVYWLPVPVEAIIDAGGWDLLTPAEQRRYLAEERARELAYAKWSRSWRGRWSRLRTWLRREAA